MKSMSMKMKEMKSKKEKPMMLEDETESSEEASSEPMPESKVYEEMELKHMADTVMQAHEYMCDEGLMKQLEPYLDKKKKAVHSLDSLKALGRAKSKAAMNY